MRDSIRSVLVAGDGIVGWATAAALKRHLPQMGVTLLALPPDPDALADRLASALPSLPGFLDDLGIGLEDGILRAGSGWRLGTRFTGWSGKECRYMHAYGRTGQPFGPTSFYLHWLRAERAGLARPFDRHNATALFADAGQMPPSDAADLFGEVERGLTLTPARFRQMLAAFARHVGVASLSGVLAGVEASHDRIDAVHLADGRALTADLFVDATGPAAPLRQALGGKWESWRPWLPCDRLLLTEAPSPDVPVLLADVTALPAGYGWHAASPWRSEHGLAFGSDWLDADEAAALLPGGAGDRITLGAGTRPDPWRSNCLALGEAAVQIDPLEWCPLHLALSGVDRMIALMPGRDCAAVELAEYNRQALGEARRARDFVALHYATARRPEPFWQAAAAVEPPESLALTLSLFRERGRLPYFAEETFSRESWVSVLIGQGERPRRIDPVTDIIPVEQAAAAMATHARAIDAALPYSAQRRRA